MFKKLLVLAISLTLLGSMLYASGRSNTNQSASAPVDISLWQYPRFDGQDDFFNKKVIPAFNAAHPNVTVTVTTIPWDGGPEKVNIAIASGSTPDILFDTEMRGHGYAERGVLVPLNDVITANSRNLDAVFQNSVAVGGNQYLAPIYTAGCASMVVNVALAEQYGIANMLPTDHMSWTLDEFYAFCRAATNAGRANGVYGIGMFAGSQSSDSNTMSWLMGSGSTILNSGASEVALNSNAAAQTLDAMAKLVKDGLALPGAPTIIDDEIIELFLNGKVVVCQYGDLWTINEGLKRKEAGEITGPMDPQYYLFPTLSGKPGKSVSYGATGLMVFNNKDTARIAAAKEFVGFFMNSEYESEFIEKAGQMAARSGYSLYKDKPKVTRQLQVMNTFAPYFLPKWGNQLGCWSEVRTTFYPEIQAVYIGQKNGKTALDSFAANANRIIKANN